MTLLCRQGIRKETLLLRDHTLDGSREYWAAERNKTTQWTTRPVQPGRAGSKPMPGQETEAAFSNLTLLKWEIICPVLLRSLFNHFYFLFHPGLFFSSSWVGGVIIIYEQSQVSSESLELPGSHSSFSPVFSTFRLFCDTPEYTFNKMYFCLFKLDWCSFLLHATKRTVTKILSL